MDVSVHYLLFLVLSWEFQNLYILWAKVTSNRNNCLEKFLSVLNMFLTPNWLENYKAYYLNHVRFNTRQIFT